MYYLFMSILANQLVPKKLLSLILMETMLYPLISGNIKLFPCLLFFFFTQTSHFQNLIYWQPFIFYGWCNTSHSTRLSDPGMKFHKTTIDTTMPFETNFLVWRAACLGGVSIFWKHINGWKGIKNSDSSFKRNGIQVISFWQKLHNYPQARNKVFLLSYHSNSNL